MKRGVYLNLLDYQPLITQRTNLSRLGRHYPFNRIKKEREVPGHGQSVEPFFTDDVWVERRDHPKEPRLRPVV